VLSELYEKKLGKDLNLKFLICNSGNLFFENITNAMLEKPPTCSCMLKHHEFICPTCNQPKNSVAVVVMSRLGLEQPEKKYLKVLSKLMEIEYCQGVIGGKPRKALYFIGKENDHFIYLDPHYVQKADEDAKTKEQTYFCGSFRMCKSGSIDSSIGICFYLRGIKELNNFHRVMNKLKTECYEDFFIFMADEVPAYIKLAETKPMQFNSMIEDVFESI
jgi:cysteine protease ATG4